MLITRRRAGRLRNMGPNLRGNPRTARNESVAAAGNVWLAVLVYGRGCHQHPSEVLPGARAAQSAGRRTTLSNYQSGIPLRPPEARTVVSGAQGLHDQRLDLRKIVGQRAVRRRPDANWSRSNQSSSRAHGAAAHERLRRAGGAVRGGDENIRGVSFFARAVD